MGSKGRKPFKAESQGLVAMPMHVIILSIRLLPTPRRESVANTLNEFKEVSKLANGLLKANEPKESKKRDGADTESSKGGKKAKTSK